MRYQGLGQRRRQPKYRTWPTRCQPSALTDSKMKGDPLNSGCPRGLWDGLEADGEAESVGLFGDAAHDVDGFASGEVVGPEFVVVDVVHEHVPDRGEQRVLDRDDGPLFATSGCQAVVALPGGSSARKIPKPGGSGKVRSLGIPMVADRSSRRR